MKKCIVTFANNEERYIKGADRLEKSLKEVGFNGDFIRFNGITDLEGCPKHEDIPYAFKPYAIEKCRNMGYELVLWCDSPVYAIKPLDNLFNYIEKKGILLFDNIGFTVGDYTSDDCIAHFGVSRNDAFDIKMVMACVMGFNFTKPIESELFYKYLEATKIDGCYEGDWKNDNRQVSMDVRVKGHRHDQSVISLLAASYGMELTHPHSTYFAYFNNPGHLPHADTVCLLSHGY